MPQTLPETVAELMTKKVVTIGENDSLAQLEHGMQRFHFRHLPVVADGRLLGLVSHRDILHASASFLSDEAEHQNARILQQPASAIMQREVVTIRPHEPLLAAARLMWEAKLGCLPVTDDDNRLLGILTEADFIKLAIQMLGDGTMPPPPSGFGGR
jgi:CBS domain-containing membrane protein